MRYSFLKGRSNKAVYLTLCALVLALAPHTALAQMSTCRSANYERENCVTGACAQPQDPSIMNIMQTNSWYTVNINPAFSLEMRQAIVTAFNNWQNSGSAGGVTFSFTYSSEPVYWVDQYGAVQGIPNALQIDPKDLGAYVGGNTTNWNGAAYMNLSSRITCPTLMTQVAAHEIGHQMGLADCPTCCMGVSVMAPMAGNVNELQQNTTGGGRDAPSSCDQQTAAQRRQQEDNNQEESQSPGGGGDSSLVESTTETCSVIATYKCYWNGSVYTNCTLESYRILGCYRV